MEEEKIKCPYCSEMIINGAKKCKHCGEFLDKSLRAQGTQNKSSGTAAMLSFFWAGLGQIYNGQVAKGVFYVFAYCFLLAWAYLNVNSSFAAALPEPGSTVSYSKELLTQRLYISFGMSFVIGILPLLWFWIYGIKDAYKTAEKINCGSI